MLEPAVSSVVVTVAIAFFTVVGNCLGAERGEVLGIAHRSETGSV